MLGTCYQLRVLHVRLLCLVHFIAIELFVEVLPPPVNRLAFLREKVSFHIPAHVGARHVAFAGTVNLLIEFSRVIGTEQLLLFRVISIFLLALVPFQD